MEPVRYGPGSNFMGMLSTLLTEGDRPGEPSVPRAKRFLAALRSDPRSFLRSLSVRRWSQRTTVMLVMQSLDNSLNVSLKRNTFGKRTLASTQGTGEPNPSWIPEAHEVATRFAEKTGGEARGTWTEALNIPMTAHILGGAPIGDSPQTGVIDPYQRVYGHDGIHVVDGAAVSANLGVNPSLTITAQAERAMSLWPNKGEADPRPEPGSDVPAGRRRASGQAGGARGRARGAGVVTERAAEDPPPAEERILQATLDGLTQLDPAALTLQRICRAAEVTAPTVYYHFGNKDGLIAAAVERLVADWLEMMDAAVEPRGQPRSDPRAGHRRLDEATITAPTRPIAVFAWATLLLAGSSEECRDALIRARDRGPGP